MKAAKPDLSLALPVPIYCNEPIFSLFLAQMHYLFPSVAVITFLEENYQLFSSHVSHVNPFQVTVISPFQLIRPLIAKMFTVEQVLAPDTVLESANSLICSRKAPSLDPMKIQKPRKPETVIFFMAFLPLEPLVEKHFWTNQQHQHLACHLETRQQIMQK